MSNIPFPQLQAFLAVARLQSFTGAARELCLSRSAVSHSVQQLEAQLRVPLLVRTTRSVALTESGRRLVAVVGPAIAQTAAILSEVSAKPGEPVGRLRLSVPRVAINSVIEPVLPVFRERYPRLETEIVVDDRLVDIVAGGFDAGIRFSEVIERDMVRVRLTDPFRFLVVGSPSYLARRGAPQRPEDLEDHDCIAFRSPTDGAPYAWELERGRKVWRIQVRGAVATNDGLLCASLARSGLGLAYVPEPIVSDDLRAGILVTVLEPYAPSEPGFFLYYPNRAQRSVGLALFIEVAKAVLPRTRR